MKKVVFLSLFALSLVACKKDNGDCDDPSSNIIRLKASVARTSMAKSGPINSNFTSNFPIGVYAYNLSWQAGSTANVINNDTATVLGAAGHSVVFGSGPYYYPSDGTTVNFFAFAPRGTETTAAGSGSSPVVNINMTGQEDIMWASSTGYKNGSNPAVPPILNFAHKLTQLQFTFVAGTDFPTNNKVVSLTVSAQPTAASMTVATGACSFSGSAPMQALSATNQTNGIGITASPGTNANSPVMTKISTGSTAYLLTIVVKQGNGQPDVTYTDVPVDITTVAGSAHMITLTFSETAITASASVADWVTGTGGSVTVL